MASSPLKPQWFQILLSLSDRPLHGYGIQRAVLDQTDGQMRLWPAMLYRSLNSMEEVGFIRQIDAPEDEPDDERRQYYSLTRPGRHVLAQEADRMARWADMARGVSKEA